ncbi:probable RNA-dependent RNA polymerase 5 isoform X4 [Rhododendron vialii]|uniref:probable RNA-dependent RNA polymerase 5 isoform X4 n=1 Tax=Rhododendron vialii TaxID=182163 RepID=UPI00265EB0B7|nr:probable RNA-dependent RNA polymerase 5 isoform X4 [Rhododendron vialii]
MSRRTLNERLHRKELFTLVFFCWSCALEFGFVRWNGYFDGDMYWVSRNPEVVIPDELKAEKFPHYMGRTNSYHSTSVLGPIYDTIEKSSQSEDLPAKGCSHPKL